MKLHRGLPHSGSYYVGHKPLMISSEDDHWVVDVIMFNEVVDWERRHPELTKMRFARRSEALEYVTALMEMDPLPDCNAVPLEAFTPRENGYRLRKNDMVWDLERDRRRWRLYRGRIGEDGRMKYEYPRYRQNAFESLPLARVHLVLEWRDERW